MSAGAVPVQVDQASLEQKITGAAAQASSIVAMFSPAAAQAVAAGVEVEPIVSGLVKLFIHFFTHHATKAIASPPSPASPQPGA